MYQDKKRAPHPGGSLASADAGLRAADQPRLASSGPAVRAPPRPSRPAVACEGARPMGGAACGPQVRADVCGCNLAKGPGLAQFAPP